MKRANTGVLARWASCSFCRRPSAEGTRAHMQCGPSSSEPSCHSPESPQSTPNPGAAGRARARGEEGLTGPNTSGHRSSQAQGVPTLREHKQRSRPGQQLLLKPKCWVTSLRSLSAKQEGEAKSQDLSKGCPPRKTSWQMGLTVPSGSSPKPSPGRAAITSMCLQTTPRPPIMCL